MTYTVLYRVFVAAKKYPSSSKERSVLRNVTRFQSPYFGNVYRMNKASPLSPLSDIRLCSFDPIFKTNSQYICYKYEQCCQQGCCSNLDRYSQSWLFWLIIAAFLMIFYLGSWYCKKMQMKPKRMRLRGTNGAATPSSLNSSPRVSPRRASNDENANRFLEYFGGSCRVQTINEVRPRVSSSSEPPPKYQEALSMPKLVRGNVQIAQIHANGGPSTAENENAGRPNENLPTYEDAVQISNRNDKENA